MSRSYRLKRFPAWAVITAAIALFVCTEPTASADISLDFSGTFGQYSWDHGPLDNGSFSGTITLASLPAANSEFAGDVTANVNFYNSANSLLFSVANSASQPVWVTLTAGSQGYTQLTVSGYGSTGTSTVDVASLDLKFNSNGTLNSSSSIEYTYLPSTTYFAPIDGAEMLIAAEPSTFAVCLISTLGALIYARFRRRPAAV
jgi:hypothetical protein